MIPTSAEFKTAIDAPTRRIVPNAVIDLTDPDLDVTTISGDYLAGYSFPAQLPDKDMTYSGAVYATLEMSRWILDGSQMIMPDSPLMRGGEQGVIGDSLSNNGCAIGTSITIEFNDVEILQSVTVASTGVMADGRPDTLTLDVYSNNVVMYSATETINADKFVFEGFTVTQPDKIVLTVDKWSLPFRRFRFVELLPGHIETWGADTIFKFDVIRKCDISNLTLPFASATLEINNTDKRFDPSNKNGIFRTLTARQPVTMSLGVEINGSVEYVQTGIYYLNNLGWKTQNDGLTMQFDMVDIVGLLANRKFVLSGAQPTTLEGWIAEIVNQLGTTFTGHYAIDDGLTSALTCDPLEDMSCGDLLRYVCQAVGAFPMSDENGYLHIYKINNAVRRQITLRSQNTLPVASANQNVAFLAFDVNGTEYNIPGTEEISGQTVTIKNPFITTLIGADLASQAILPQYGGNALSLNWRGDMSVEPGDIEIVEIYPDQLTAARVVENRLTLANGVMTNVPAKLLQADGANLYTDYIIITESGTYTMPAGITDVTIVLIGGGDGGTGGPSGAVIGDAYGATGRNGGLGGKVYTAPITINDGQSYTVNIGRGGNGGAGGHFPQGYEPASVANGHPGEAGGDTTVDFGIVYSSASGVRMDHGYVDLLTNKVYGVPGAEGLPKQDPPKAGRDATQNTGNGGEGGQGGRDGIVGDYNDDGYPDYVIEMPLNGAVGGRGADGVCIIFYVR